MIPFLIFYQNYNVLYSAEYSIGCLTNFGKRLFRFHYNNTSLLLKKDNYDSNIIPYGITMISECEESNNYVLKWEKKLSYDNFYQFSRKYPINKFLVNYIAKIEFPKTYFPEKSYFNLTIQNDKLYFGIHSINIDKNSIKIHRIMGRTVSKSFIKGLKNLSASIFDPIPSFCKIIRKTVYSTCEKFSYEQRKHGIDISLQDLNNCHYKYGLNCKMDIDDDNVTPTLVFHDNQRYFATTILE